MMPYRIFAYSLVIACSLQANPQNAPNPAEHSLTLIKAARLLDVRKGAYIENAAILVDGERIKEVGLASDIQAHAPKVAKIIDLGSATVLPGLIDCHTHMMARFDDTPDGYILGLATKSQAFRALEGAANARATLQAGFTSTRDVENEGSGYADVALRDAINQGLVEGPRMQVATRGIVAVGQYYPFGVSTDLADFPRGAQMVSGVEEARRAVREQIGNGADLIKVYADWETPTLTIEELTVIVQEAHKLGHKVAAHATTPQGIKNAVNAGVDSIEHGHRADHEAIDMMKARGVFLVPTIAVVDADIAKLGTLSPDRQHHVNKFLAGIQDEIQYAMSQNVKIAMGFDASEKGRHGKNADELIAMAKRGMPDIEVIRAATINGAELMSWQDNVGAVEPGKYADLIAVDGDPLKDISLMKNIRFVMKDGEVVKDISHP